MKYYPLFLVHCFFIHLQILYENAWFSDISSVQVNICVNLLKGVLLLLYPVCGWIAGLFACNFKMIKWSFILSFFNSVMMVIGGIGLLFIYRTSGIFLGTGFYIIILSLYVIASLLSLGMYQANALQLGMDQMIEASSDHLSSFIHWYFWCTRLGPVIWYYFFATLFMIMKDCRFEIIREITHTINFYGGILTIAFSTLQLIIMGGGIAVVYWMKQFMHNQLPINSLRQIYQVLQYAYHHKQPVRRSAMTYWEDYMPSRIDLGKDKYGGPFTYEQVEDVKTFFRLLLLILSLFGFHLLGDGYSFSHYVMNVHGCPSSVPLLFIIGNPQHVPILTVLIGVPLYRVIKKMARFRFPGMQTIIGIGLWSSLLTQAVLILYSSLLEEHKFSCPEVEPLQPNSNGTTIFKTCVLANIDYINNNSSCNHFCRDSVISNSSWVLYVSILYLVLHGISYLLVFMTTLEFICAQSPRAVTGLLIGIWYSTTSIKYLVTNILDVLPALLQTNTWAYYNGGKALMIFLSIILYSLVCRYYRYRERNEVVNEQAIIEEQYERELLMNESDSHQFT